MRRRPEQMLSSALKFGTTDHLAPHPRQIAGDPNIGVPPLDWTYGDHAGNIRRLVDLNLKALDNAGYDDSVIRFDPGDRSFRGSDGQALSRADIDALSEASNFGRTAHAGGRTIARGAVLRALLREEGGQGQAGGRRDGLLARLAGLGNDAPEATRGLFYSAKQGAGESDGLNDSAKQTAAEPESLKPSATLPGLGLMDQATTRLSDMVDHALDKTGVYDMVAPMSGGDQQKRAMAQAHINAERQARYLWNGMAHDLVKHYTPGQRAAMWDAPDEQNLLMTRGESTAGKGIDRLPPDQRAVVEKMHQYGKQLWDKALEVGMVKGEGVPYWTPRMMAMIGEDGDVSAPGQPGGGGSGGMDGRGRNIVTSAGSAKARKYETSQETEAAMAAMGGQMVHDIATMPIAMARFQRAIAGHQLIQDIKEIGQLRGKDTVSDEKKEGFFTMMDHPAFRTYAPDFEQGPDGKTRARLDESGNPIMVSKPLYVSSEFKGPLKAIMSTEDGALYRAYMLLKSKAMSAIMFSPLTHNLVIAGRAFSYGGLKLPVLYVRGSMVRQDKEFMGKMVGAGMVPMSRALHGARVG